MKSHRLLWMVGGLAAGVLLGLGLLWGYDCYTAGQGSAAPARALEVGQPAPEITLNDLQDQSTSLSAYRGRAVILNFWATWCAPCKEEMPVLESAYQKYVDEIVVVGVNARESRDVAGAFAQEIGISFPVWLDLAGSAGAAYRVSGYPTTYFIDSGGILRAAHIGELNQEMLDRYLKTLGVGL